MGTFLEVIIPIRPALPRSFIEKLHGAASGFVILKPEFACRGMCAWARSTFEIQHSASASSAAPSSRPTGKCRVTNCERTKFISKILENRGLTRVVMFYHTNERKPMFNDTIKSLRLQKRLTLRDFCAQASLDPSNWSKVERGVNPPPGDIGLLERLADFFGLTGAEKLAFMDAAALQRREIPADVADHAILQRALPAFFRAARGHELTEKELASLGEDIKKLHTADSE